MLSCLLRCPLPSDRLQRYLLESAPNLVAHSERIARDFFADEGLLEGMRELALPLDPRAAAPGPSSGPPRASTSVDTADDDTAGGRPSTYPSTPGLVERAAGRGAATEQRSAAARRTERSAVRSGAAAPRPWAERWAERLSPLASPWAERRLALGLAPHFAGWGLAPPHDPTTRTAQLHTLGRAAQLAAQLAAGRLRRLFGEMHTLYASPPPSASSPLERLPERRARRLFAASAALGCGCGLALGLVKGFGRR